METPTSEIHQSFLAELCRLCGGYLKNQRVTYECRKHSRIIETYFKICVVRDDSQIHPGRFCHTCYSKMAVAQKRGKNSITSFAIEWYKHSESWCNTCNHAKMLSKGGRPKKYKPPQCHDDLVSSSQLVCHVNAIAPPSLAGRGIDPSVCKSTPKGVSIEDIICPVCSYILDRPIQTKCGHVVCMECCIRWLQTGTMTIPSCPVCPNVLVSVDDIKPPSPFLTSTLKLITVLCSCCHMDIYLETVNTHKCQQTPVSAPAKPKTLSAIRECPITKTPTTAEKQACTNIIKRLMRKHQTENILLPTRGQVGTIKAK